MDRPQNVISFCTGYAGLELGLIRAGVDVRTVCYVEVEVYVQAVLAQAIQEKRLCSAPLWTDLKTFPAQEFRGLVDGFTCGYPCQPFSSAGKRKGEEDPRHLWPYLRKHIQAIRPSWVFAENVHGHVSLGLSTVLADLEEDGYQAVWGIFSAEETGAPHQRKRVYILAQRKDERCRGRSDQDRDDREGLSESKGEKQPILRCETTGCCRESRELAYTENRWRKPTKSKRGQSFERGSSNRERASREGQKTKWPARPGQKQHDWEEPRVTEAKPQLGGATDGFTCGVDPIANRTDRLRLLGNGVVPQTAELAWKTLWREMNENHRQEETNNS